MNSSTIRSIHVEQYSLRFRQTYATARGRIDRRALIGLRLVAGDGLTGVGEAVSLSLRGGPSADAIAEELRAVLGPLLVWRRIETAGDVRAALGSLRRANPSAQALAAADLALWDMAGKRTDEPVWRLLGADSAPRLRCNATLTAGTPSQVAEQAEEWAADGFRTFKLKLGGTDSRRDDVGQVVAAREAVGAGARLRLDANGSWTVKRAIATLDALAATGIELCEQPVSTVSELGQVARACSVPLTADETAVDARTAALAISDGGCRAVTVKLAKVGGIEAAHRVARAAPIYLSSALDGPLGIAAALHAGALLPKDGFASDIDHGLATLRLFEGEYPGCLDLTHDGWLVAPSGPGLGVEWRP